MDSFTDFSKEEDYEFVFKIVIIGLFFFSSFSKISNK